jgi:26S proteasome regulatory subunit T4
LETREIATQRTTTFTSTISITTPAATAFEKTYAKTKSALEKSTSVQRLRWYSSLLKKKKKKKRERFQLHSSLLLKRKRDIRDIMTTEVAVPPPPAGSGEDGGDGSDPRKQQAISDFTRLMLQHKELDARVRNLRAELKETRLQFDKTERDLTALQSMGQIIGEVLRQLDEDRFIVKASSGPRYIVGCRSKLDREKLVNGTRVTLDMTTLTVMRALPREVDPVVFNMLSEAPGKVEYSSIGGLGEQIRELRESIELPLMNPELFLRVGIAPPKGVLLYGPPGTGKTLLAKAIASNIDCAFLKVVSSAIVDKYIGESARLIREMFGYARANEPCVIFMDEIDAIGGKRFSEGTSADREIQRTLMELLNQLDGFDVLGKVKMVMATNRPDVLDPALMRPGRLDRKIEIPLPNEQGRVEVLKIHAAGINKHGEIDYEAVSKVAENFNAADMRNVCTEAGMFAIREDRDYATHDDFMRAVRKLVEAKKLEPTASYDSSFKNTDK